MSRKQIILITGANGEIGKNLINYLSKVSSNNIVTLDLQPLEETSQVYKSITGSVLDKQIIDDINAECNLNTCVLADHKIKSSIIKKSQYSDNKYFRK